MPGREIEGSGARKLEILNEYHIDISRCAIAHLRIRLCEPSRNDKTLASKLFVGHDLDAEAGQSLIIVHRRRQMPDRGDAEIAQDLRADADLAPLLVAIGFGGLLLGQR